MIGGDFWTFMMPLVGLLWGGGDHSHWDVGFLCLERGWGSTGGMGEVMEGYLGKESGLWGKDVGER